jgi:5-methylcytosine-specific restriction protein A
MDFEALAGRFRRGQTYVRKRIHDSFGGQEQGGISTPRSVPAVLLFRTPYSAGSEYQDDGWQADGFYHYTGEGQFADMQMIRGNRAVRDHRKTGKTLMLFEGVRSKPGPYRFEGFMNCVDYYERHTDALGNRRRVFVFRLIPVEHCIVPGQIGQTGEATAFLDMRPDVLQLIEQGFEKPDSTKGAVDEWENNLAPIVSDDFAGTEDDGAPSIQPLPVQMPLVRNADYVPLSKHQRVADWQILEKNQRDEYQASISFVHQYVLQRANGFCEACGRPAPFLSMDGSPYLEVHNVRSVVDYGLEQPNALLAMCPTCHREAHVGLESRDMAARLDSTAANIESALDRGILKLVTAAIIRDDQGRILVAQRAKGQFAGYWEFPGGQVKPGETLKQCLVREIFEELSVDIYDIAPFMKVDYDYEAFFLRMFCLTCQARGTLELHDHTRVRWMAPQDLASLKWMPADEGIVGELGGRK